LDLFARQEGKSVETLLGIPPALVTISTSAVYGSGGMLKFRGQAFLFARNGMREAKLKLSGDPAKDLARARTLARRGRVRLDANNLWREVREAIASLSDLARHAWAVEEPLEARNWDDMREIGRRTGLVIILDESLLVR